jgi:hypothetical protein
LIRFLISVVIITIILALITYTGYHQVWWGLPSYWVEILFFIPFMTVVVFYHLNKLRIRQPEAFTQFYLISIVLKMTAGLTLISFIVWDDPDTTMGNVTLFIISYLMLTFLEVYFLLGKAAE